MRFILRSPVLDIPFKIEWNCSLCELRVERTLLTRILGELYELHEFLLGTNLSIVIFLNKVKSRSKEIRVIRTIRLKFVLDGVKNVFLTINSHSLSN